MALLFRSTRESLASPICGQVEDAADALAGAQNAAISESLIKAADSPLSLFVYKLSKRLHIGKINSIRGTRGELVPFPLEKNR